MNNNFLRTFLLVLFFHVCFINFGFSQKGLKAEYYDGTNFERLVATKYVANIDQSWLDVPPVPGIDPHECSIRWTGKLKTAKTGTYTFSAIVDDGIRVWIDGALIMDQWDLNDLGDFKSTVELTANREYDLKVEYFNGMIEGEVRLMWKMHKEELSWYEHMFGDGINPTVIMPENFLRPEEPIETIQEPKPVEKPVAKKQPTKQKSNASKPPASKPAPSVPSPPKKVAPKPDPPKPVVNAKVVEKFTPKNVQFERGETIILESSYKELNRFVNFMLRHPELNVMIEGHTDVVGDAALNLQLSKDRATKISEYLIEKGIDSNRISSEGYGGTRPLGRAKNNGYYPANRRVVFLVDGY